MANRKCIACGAEYSYCPNCSGPDRHAPYWKSQFCSEDCKTIWDTCTQFNFGKVTKAEAKSILSQISIKDKKEYAQCIQRDFETIFKEDIKAKRSKRSMIKPIDDAMVLDKTEHEVVEQED